MPERPTTYAKVFAVPNGAFLREPVDAEKLLRIPLAEPKCRHGGDQRS
jgi:hypothetical protein